ncbi:MAG TPA: type IV secretion system DNA-binding domain-containing protein [Patescibacteria group bacterium]|nr:type IV secretion system DNA-binding domain-containing protein [Patescibacteria group bacterium]
MLIYVLIPALIVVIFSIALLMRLHSEPVKEGSDGPLENFSVLEIQVPKNDDNVRGDVQLSSLASENMFATLHGLLREDNSIQEHFSLEIASDGRRGIKFYVVVPREIVKFVESQIYAQYPTSQIKVVEDYMDDPIEEGSYEIAAISLSKEEFFPIKTFRDFEGDPLAGISSSLAEQGGNDKVWFQVLVKPIPDGWQQAGYDYIETMRSGVDKLKKSSPLADLGGLFVKELVEIGTGMITNLFSPPTPTNPRDVGKPFTPQPPRLTSTQDLEIKSIESKLYKMGFEVQVRILSQGSDTERNKSNLRSVIASLRQFSTSNMNGFVSLPVSNKQSVLTALRERAFIQNGSVILNVSELATLYHFPSSSVETPNISWLFSKKSEPPASLPTKDCVYLGETIYRSQKVRFGLADTDDRLRHMYLIGKSGTGKSTLFETMVSQDIANGHGVGVLDPHGELVEKVLDYIPDDRIDDVIYFDPSDSESPVGLNLLEMEDLSQKNLMASALVSAIKHHFDYSWGPRLEYLLNYCILTLLEVPGTTMLAITRLLEDDNYRRYILHWVKDPLVNKFWETEFKAMKGNQKLVTEAIAPIQNKVNRFLASTTIRNILGQRNSTIDIWKAMNEGKILLMNLSKGKIGEDNANLLGALMVSRIQFMALQRAKIPSQSRRPFYLYVDEFQNFATGSFESILSESRKYGVGLYLTHQYTAQLPEQLLKAVFGNVGTIATFSLGAPDARALASEFAPYFSEEDIISLERFHIYIKIMMNGMTSLPFSAEILRPWVPEMAVVSKNSNRERVVRLSRQKYGVERSTIEGKINKWVETTFDKGMAIAQENRDNNSQEPKDQPPSEKAQPQLQAHGSFQLKD